MRKNRSFWLSKVRGWAAGVLVASSGLAFTGLVENATFAQDACQTCEEAPACEEEEAAPEHFTLAGTGFGERLACRGINIGGNVVQSLTFNPDSPRDRFNGPVTWTDRSNEYQLNQAWLYMEKATDGSDGCWDIGGRIDAFYGTNSRFATAQGFENSLDNGQSFYGVAVPAMYIEAAKNDVKIKVGRFISPCGYFTIDMTQNFFNTLPYTYQYGEPFTHTGAIATWTPDDHWTLSSGVTRGWDNWDGTGFGAPNVGWMGMASYAGDNDGVLTYFGHWSQEPNERTDAANNDFSGRYGQTLVFSKKLNDKWNYVFQTDYGTQVAAKANGQNAEWYGVNQYIYWTQNDCLTWGANAEWFRDDDGFRVGTLLPAFPGSEFRGLPAGRNGYIGDFFQVTVGPKWQPRENLFIRPNLRWDWFDGTLDGAKNTAGRPYDDGNSNHQFIFATDVYFTF